MDVANGDLEMKHALVQMGVSAATSGVASGLAGTAYSAASPYASQAVTMAASGIDYEAGGGIGWSGDNFKAGIKRGMVNMAISATGNSFNKGMNGTGYERVGAGLNSGVSSFVNSGLDVDNGSWWRIGWKEEGTMDHVMAGIASATASAATYSKTGQNPSKNTKGETTYDKYNYDGDFSQEGYNNKLLYNTINSGMMSLYNMAAHDLSWEDASNQNGFYSGMLYDHKDVGGRLGKFVASGFDPDFDRKQSVPQDDNNKNPNNEAETLLGGLWQGLKQIGDDAADIGSAVTNGFAGNGLISDKEIARVQRESLAKARSEYAGYQNYMAAQNLQLSDIADAVNAANNGGARGDANANMSKLLTALNNKFGLEGEDRITSAEDMQAVISSGRVNVNDVMTVALESSNNNATFANVYGVAGGVRSGSLVADDNGFYTKGGQMVAGRYVENNNKIIMAGDLEKFEKRFKEVQNELAYNRTRPEYQFIHKNTYHNPDYFRNPFDNCYQHGSRLSDLNKMTYDEYHKDHVSVTAKGLEITAASQVVVGEADIAAWKGISYVYFSYEYEGKDHSFWKRYEIDLESKSGVAADLTSTSLTGFMALRYFNKDLFSNPINYIETRIGKSWEGNFAGREAVCGPFIVGDFKGGGWNGAYIGIGKSVGLPFSITNSVTDYKMKDNPKDQYYLWDMYKDYHNQFRIERPNYSNAEVELYNELDSEYNFGDKNPRLKEIKKKNK